MMWDKRKRLRSAIEAGMCGNGVRSDLMSERAGERVAREGHKTVWGFFILGIIVLLAGIFIHFPTQPVSLPKAETLTGVGLIIAAIASLVITA